MYQHLGHEGSSGWCIICGSVSHSAMTCTRHGGGHNPGRHKTWCVYRKSISMKKFLSELTHPSENSEKGISFYLFAGTPRDLTIKEQRALTRGKDPSAGSESSMGRLKLNSLKQFKKDLFRDKGLFRKHGRITWKQMGHAGPYLFKIHKPIEKVAGKTRECILSIG